MLNAGQSKHGVFTNRPETLTNDFFVKPAHHEYEVAGLLYNRRRV